MMGGDNRLESASVHMRVDLCGGDVGMPQQFLDDTQIRAAGQQMRGERMSEHVGMDVVHAGFPGQSTDDLPYSHSFKRSTGVAQEESSIIAAIIEPRELGVEMLHILSDGLAGGHANRHQSFTIALPCTSTTPSVSLYSWKRTAPTSDARRPAAYMSSSMALSASESS